MNRDLRRIDAVATFIPAFNGHEVIDLQVAGVQNPLLASDDCVRSDMNCYVGVKPCLQYEAIRAQLDDLSIEPCLCLKPYGKAQGAENGTDKNRY